MWEGAAETWNWENWNFLPVNHSYRIGNTDFTVIHLPTLEIKFKIDFSAGMGQKFEETGEPELKENSINYILFCCLPRCGMKFEANYFPVV